MHFPKLNVLSYFEFLKETRRHLVIMQSCNLIGFERRIRELVKNLLLKFMQNTVECKDRVVNIAGSAPINTF